MRKFLVISAILMTASMSSAAYAGGNTIVAPIITLGSTTVTVGTSVTPVVTAQTQTNTPVTTQVATNVAVAALQSAATATSNITAASTAISRATTINFGHR